MTVVGKYQRFSLLAWILILTLTGTCFSQNPRRFRRAPNQQQANPQNQQPATSTAEQEAEPNTANYPQRPVFAPGNPNTNPSTPAPGQIAPTPSAIQPGNQAPQANQAQSSPAAPPQGQGFIGPPVPIPPTPEQMPPGAPKIVYQDGVLSVESFNSKLTDILNGIHSKTGIQFEGLQSSPDRVAGKFGPAPAGEVLTTLLSGSRYDYVIVGLQDNPTLVQRVILSPSTAAGTVAGAAAGAPGGNQQANANGDDEDNGSEETEAQPEQVQAPEPQQVQPMQPVAPRPNANNQPKTTEQLLEELKQIQQQNQQRQPPTAPIKPMPQ